jgi:hypothetical protein
VVSGLLGVPIALSDGQQLAVNDEPLTRVQGSFVYTASVALADTYVVSVTEPTRGVETTSVDGPAAFTITSPTAGQGASLSGFTISWSNADAALEVAVHVSQTILGQVHAFLDVLESDSGSFTLGTSDLSDFQQGADMTITVARSETVEGLNGFSAARISLIRSESVEITPAP